MGEVYRAKDTKLGRDVALKILPASFTNDPERVARFRREAQVLASLNHTHIAQIHGMEEANGTQFLVLELVDGESLDKWIARGPIPVDEALGIAKQIAEALEAAHEKGIIHRDLKPANIALTQDGNVKVLDFGLAKAVESTSGAALDAMNSPTITSPAMMTSVGVILGTAAYISPEQAKGRPADKRSDIWAFGCVLYEMLAGMRAFDGEDVPETLAAVLRGEPDWEALPASTPALIRALVARCLAKDPNRRVADIAAPLFVLDAAPSDPSAFLIQRQALWRRALPVATAIVITASVVGTVVGFTALRLRSVPVPLVTRFVIALPEEHRSFGGGTTSLAVSPDGSLIAYSGFGQRNPGVYLRAMADLEPRAIPGIGNVAFPVFSPDSRFIAFWSSADRTLRRISVNGGLATTLCTTGETLTGLSWDKGGIVFGLIGQGIMRVSVAGGEPERLINAREGETLRGPTILPGGDAVLFSVENGAGMDRAANAQVVVQSLRTGERKIIAESGTDARYLASGHLVYVAGSTLFALPFNVQRLTAVGQPVPVLEGVRRSAFGVAEFSVSESGSLAYLPGPSSSSSRSDIVVMTLDGTEKPLNLPPASYEHPRVSPDGKQIVFDTDNGSEATVWIYNLSGTTAMRRLTFAGSNRFPIWSADGERIAFQSNREGDFGIFSQRADRSGAVERLTRPDRGTAHVPDSWSQNGEYLLFEATKGSTVSLWALSLGDKRVVPFGESNSQYRFNAVFSPDGRWVAYAGRVATSGGVFVQPFPPTGAKYQLSASGMYPLWAPDGSRLFYNIPGQFVAVSVTTQPTVAFGNPVAVPRGTFLAFGPLVARNHDITPDGKAIVGVIMAASDQTQTGASAFNQIQVVTNWFEELKARVPTK